MIGEGFAFLRRHRPSNNPISWIRTLLDYWLWYEF